MATIHPPISTIHPTTAGTYRERDILKLLEQGLPSKFDVFHSVEWSAMHDGDQGFGEFDAVVVAPTGHLVLLEVKAGQVVARAQGLVKFYSDSGANPKDVEHQARRQHSAMMDRLSKSGLHEVHVSHLLVLADQVIDKGTVTYPRERIVDATQLDLLCSLVKNAIPKNTLPEAIRVRVMDFLANRLKLHPDTATHIGQVQRANIHLAEGLATWVPRISHSGGVFNIEATAGSGKSQLALTLLREAAGAHLRAAYVCYNRPLADHITSVAPHSVEVGTFHEHCVTVSRRLGIEPDFNAPLVWQDTVNRFLANAQAQPARLDLLIIDESQDFDPAWLEALASRLKDDGRLYVMGDTDQQVYGRDAFDLADAVQISSRDNFRSPRKVVQAINQLKLASEPVHARSVLLGQSPGFHTYAHGKSAGVAALEKCLKTLMGDGVAPAHIAVLTFAGRDHSEVLARATLAGLPVKRFTGRYDKASNPLWTSGDLLVETLYRFKGQSAPVVVLCEVDFEQLTAKELHKLFVGFTRAEFRLECVLSERSATLLMSAL
jgi:hypothetical protein